MEKLPMCRICLVQNVRMFVVANRNLRELYEKLTDIPFVTEDRRPILACFFCCTKLKQCYRLLRQCLEAEVLFAQKIYELDSLINQEHLEILGGFVISPTENISIVDVVQTDSIAVKEEFPAVCETLDIIIEPKEEHQSDELDPEKLDNSCLDVVDISPHHSEDDVPLIEFKTEVEEQQEIPKMKRRTSETTRAIVAMKPILDTRRTILEDAVTAEQTREDRLDTKVIRTTQKHSSKPGTKFKEPCNSDLRSFNKVKKIIQHTCTHIGEKTYKCDVCQRSFSKKRNLINHTREHTGEKPFKCYICQCSFSQNGTLTRHIRDIHPGEKPYMCDICQCRFRLKNSLKRHIRRIHPGEKPYKCDVCQRSFNDKCALSDHIRIHTGEKPFKCDICQCSFRQKGALTKHIRIHTGEKPYMCDVCKRSFRSRGNLKSHIRIHTGEKPYKCDVCQRRFSEKRALNKHSNTHCCKCVVIYI